MPDTETRTDDRFTEAINGFQWERDSLVIEETPACVREKYVCFANNYRSERYHRDPWDPADKDVIDGANVPEYYGWGASEAEIENADIELEDHLRLRNYEVPDRYQME